MTTTSVTSSGSGAPLQISGLVSGLDTTSIISELMSVASEPQQLEQAQLTNEQTKLSAMQSINTGFQSLLTSAQSFDTASTWTQLAATSSNSAITVTADSSASQGSFSLTVESTASAAQVGFSDAHALSDVVTTPSSTLSITMPGSSTPLSVDTGDGTLSSVISALNGLQDSSGHQLLNAQAVNMGDGTYKLLVNAADTGQGELSIAASDGTPFLGTATTVAGTDATVSLGAGMTITQSSNTFTDIVPGVTLTLAAGAASTAGASSPATISVNDDGSNRAASVNAFITQINSLLQQIATTTAYGTVPTTPSGDTTSSTSTGAGPLPGDSTMRNLASQLTDAVFPNDGSESMADFGISVDDDGTISFDSSQFEKAYQANPTAVQNAFLGDSGLASRIEAVSHQASDPVTGAISSEIQGENSTISSLNDSIDNWTQLLAQKQQSLETQYTALETSLSTLQSQESYMESQLDSLDSSSSSN